MLRYHVTKHPLAVEMQNPIHVASLPLSVTNWTHNLTQLDMEKPFPGVIAKFVYANPFTDAGLMPNLRRLTIRTNHSIRMDDTWMEKFICQMSRGMGFHGKLDKVRVTDWFVRRQGNEPWIPLLRSEVWFWEVPVGTSFAMAAQENRKRKELLGSDH
jgi:hypothetical protein